jgi:hypothetical protein
MMKCTRHLQLPQNDYQRCVYESFSVCFVFHDLILSEFEKQTISETYNKETYEFDVWVRPIWTWVEDMLQSPDLIQHFEWDACRMSKFDKQSNSWVRFYDKPWTADRFWETQVCGIHLIILHIADA